MTASDKLVQLLKLQPNEAVAVHNPSNMFYLTEGYSGEGMVYVSAARRVIVTDFRYTEQAEKQAPGFEVVMTERGMNHSQWVARLCKEGGVDTLYYEDDTLTVRQFEAFKAVQAGDTVSVNFDTGLITDETTGQTFQGQSFPPFMQKLIDAGGLIPYINSQE